MARKTNVDAKLDMLVDLVRENHRDTKSAIEKLDAKVEKIDGRVDNLDVTSGKQAIVLQNNTRSLDEHIKRTNLLENKLEAEVSKVFKKMEHNESELSKKIGPLKTTDTKIKLFMKIAGALLAAGGSGFGLSKLIGAVFGGGSGH